MALRKGRKRPKMMSDMNVVPYIDVMLVLLIIFMATAPLITQGVKVELPQATSEPVEAEKPPVIVSVDAEGRLYIDYGDDRETPAEPDALAAKAAAILRLEPEARFLVNGDAAASYQHVVRAMAVLQAAGVKSVGLMTQPPRG